MRERSSLLNFGPKLYLQWSDFIDIIQMPINLLPFFILIKIPSLWKKTWQHPRMMSESLTPRWVSRSDTEWYSYLQIWPSMSVTKGSIRISIGFSLYCPHHQQRWQEETGTELPTRPFMDDPRQVPPAAAPSKTSQQGQNLNFDMGLCHKRFSGSMSGFKVKKALSWIFTTSMKQ